MCGLKRSFPSSLNLRLRRRGIVRMNLHILRSQIDDNIRHAAGLLSTNKLSSRTLSPQTGWSFPLVEMNFVSGTGHRE